MKKIMFKAKRKDNGEWVYWNIYGMICNKNGKLRRLSVKRNIATTSYYNYIHQIITLIDKNTICQYTGLTDKNGNKIWENDVVKDTDIHLLGSVEYDEEHGMYVINEVNDGYQNFQEFWSCTEVIGNIFDNPEMLGGQ